VDYFVLKLTRTGGIWPSLLQLGVALSAGHGLLVSGLSDSMVTKLAACQVAAAFGSETPAALNGSQFMDDSLLFPTKPKIEHGGSVHLDETPGLGIEPDESALRAQAWKAE
jgi:L-alanine-DL-glutamate epimerase-like enolase superfamily enzyme